ncbi:MAG: nitrogenase [Firmicutes bacterium]|nr:nitrogenase [Bacillota bacterium]
MEIVKTQANQPYRSVNENPCHMCMPLGGILAFAGIEQSMVMLHGSQGCSTYMRRHIAEHFNEPIDVASSSLNEKGTIYGGEANLKKGLDNLMQLYQPKLIGVLTTCLAETIGEDVDRITLDYKRERGMDDFPLVSAPTPGYGGTHTEGYWQALRKIVTGVASKPESRPGVNIIVPNLSPADVREIKRVLGLLQVDFTMFPDVSENLDRPWARPYQKVAQGGTRIEDLKRMPGARATIEMSLTVDDALSPGQYLKDEWRVPLYRVPVPIGIENTDRFIEVVSGITGASVPQSLKDERGRLLDCMVDSHKYNSRGRAVVFGEPDLVHPIVATCRENGIHPVIAATGGRSKKLTELIDAFPSEAGQTIYLDEADFMGMLEKGRAAGVNLAIGHSGGKFLEEKEDIPLIRVGFPIHDRTGGQRVMSVGYTGTAMFLDRVTNALLESLHRNYRISMYQQYYQGYRKRPVVLRKRR